MTTTTASEKITATQTTPRQVVAALWLFVSLFYIYCDVVGLMYPPHLKEYLSGNLNGLVIDQPFLLSAMILMTIPLGSVLISRIAPYRFARWESIVAGAVMAAVQVGTFGLGSGPTLAYTYCSIIEVAGTVAITWVAARYWKLEV
jgi:hypothetical protein